MRACCRRAKERRERLRGSHVAPEYIPLGGAGVLGSAAAATDPARLPTTGGGLLAYLECLPLVCSCFHHRGPVLGVIMPHERAATSAL